MLGPYLLFFYQPQVRRAINGLWQRVTCRMAGLEIEVRGEPVRDGKRLFVGNHVSYLDIPVIASQLPDVCFVAKAEVRSWPFFGFLANLARTVYIRREPAQAMAQRDLLNKRMTNGDSLYIFAEGTSTNGHDVLAFKSSLFSITEARPGEEPITVQPVSIAYVRYADGRPLIGGLEDYYAWYGDMDLGPHLSDVLGLKGAKVRLTFHDPMVVEPGRTRKEVAKVAQQAVSEGVQRSRAYWLG